MGRSSSSSCRPHRRRVLCLLSRLRLELLALLHREVALGGPDPDKGVEQQRDTRDAGRQPKGRLVALPPAEVGRLADDDVADAQEEADAQEQQAVDEGAGEALAVGRQVRRDEDVADRVGDVDADGAAHHGREHVGPVVGPLGDDGEEQHAQHVARARHGEQDAAGQQVQREAADGADDDAADDERHVPHGRPQRRHAQHRLDVEARVEEEEAERAVGQEERRHERLHGPRRKEVARHQRLRRHAALDVPGGREQGDAQHERHDDLRARPPGGRVRAVGDGVDDEQQAGDDGGDAPPVHADLSASLVVVVAAAAAAAFLAAAAAAATTTTEIARDGQEGDGGDEAEHDAAEPKVPAPAEELARHAADEDAEEEADGGEGAVEGEDEVLARARAVGLAEEHDAGGQVGGGAEPLEGAADDEREVVVAEAGGEAPDEEPGEPGVEGQVAAVHVAEAAERQQEGPRDEGEDARRPGLGGGGDVELRREGREDDVEAADEVLLWGCLTAINMDPKREKQKPSSDHREAKTAGRCRPRNSTSNSAGWPSGPVSRSASSCRAIGSVSVSVCGHE
ncbi:hypothetical protein CTA1_3441 [Colletotrichum tanaceti]|uniref:Uncharacterized protein n=1 Tax=Colletotrichum tanaceti TaxID=1306861 RepID=A0A4U6XFH3_9PEZI|nr:hypothetical protein CTA1_3441 [Colletotrichum tanaceti]